ncbi:hypothetical protein G6F24_015666 [Rhizopus arrhizus]|nr:hypothetical protein G6F24_015666 [Rhizopus arrhizus]
MAGRTRLDGTIVTQARCRAATAGRARQRGFNRRYARSAAAGRVRRVPARRTSGRGAPTAHLRHRAPGTAPAAPALRCCGRCRSLGTRRP